MKGLRLLDCNCTVGADNIVVPNQPVSPAAVLDEMKYYGIAGALVSSESAKDRGFRFGNQHLLNVLPASEKLWPCAVLVPNSAQEVESLDGYIGELVRRGVKAVRLCPHAHRFSLKAWSSGELWAAIERAQLPVLLDASENTWDELDEFFGLHPALRFILTRVSWTAERALHALLARHPNFSAEISSLQGHCAVEEICARFGARRLVFGTDLPKKDPGATIAALSYARIGEEEREKIAWRNLRELLGLTELPAPAEPSNLGERFVRHGWEGSPVSGALVMDAHAHVAQYEFHVARNDPSAMVATMDCTGTQKACVFGLLGHHADSNDAVAAAVRQFPDRLIGFAILNPRCGGELEAELERFDRLGMRGLKVHPTSHAYPVDEPRYEPVWKFAVARNVPVLAHGGGGPEADLRRYAKVLERHPALRLIVAHAGRSYESADEYIALAQAHANVYLEITYSSVAHRIIEYLVAGVGAERVLFGTDMPFRDPRPQLGWVLFSRISSEAKKKVLGLNFEKLFGMSGGA